MTTTERNALKVSIEEEIASLTEEIATIQKTLCEGPSDLNFKLD